MKRSFTSWIKSMAAAIVVGLPCTALYAQLIGGGAGVGGGAKVEPAAPALRGAVEAPAVRVAPAAPAPSVRVAPAPSVRIAPVPSVRAPAPSVRVAPGASVAPSVRAPSVGVPGVDARIPGVAPGASASGNLSGRAGGRASAAVPLQLSDSAVSNLGVGGNLGMTIDAREKLRVGRLDTGALAGTAGFRVGDEILAVNRAWVRTPVELRNQLNAAVQSSGRAWVYVNRNGTREWVNLDLAAASRGRLGVDVRDRGGVVSIANVHSGSVASTAGLLTGDIVRSVNGVSVATQADLSNQIRAAARATGDVTLDIVRDGAEQTLRVNLRAAGNAAARADLPRVRTGIAADTAGSLGIVGDLGMTLDTVDQLRIGRLDTGALAGTAGFRVGDRFLAVNRAWVRTPADLRAQLNAAQVDGRAWVYVNRNGVGQWVNLDLSAAAGGGLGVNVQDRGGVVTIANVYPGSVALAAGLRAGDVVLAANGIPIATQAQLTSEIRAAAEANGDLMLDIRRNGIAQSLRAQVAADGGVAAGVRARR